MTETAAPTVYVVDDDAAVRQAMETLMISVGFRIESFPSAAEFLACRKTDSPSCLVLDVRLPWMSGIELQRRLNLEHNDIPIVFITGHGDVPMSVEAMKAGAVEFLTKPVRGQEILDAVNNALAKSQTRLEDRAKTANVRRRLESLTPRESEVMQRVIAGQLNKKIAFELNISERTVKIDRAGVMRKMGVESLPELVRIVVRAGS